MPPPERIVQQPLSKIKLQQSVYKLPHAVQMNHLATPLPLKLNVLELCQSVFAGIVTQRLKMNTLILNDLLL